jgi:hypothetical protein
VFAPLDYQRRLASLERAEATRCGTVPPSFAAIAMARRLGRPRTDKPGAVDPVRASRPDASPFLLQD